MALNYGATYPGQMDIDAVNYPQGKPRNVVVLGDGTGTPWEKQLAQDLFGFLQACLKQGHSTISDVPDTAIASDYFDSLRKALREQSAIFDWVQSKGSLANGSWEDPTSSAAAALGVFFSPAHNEWYICGSNGMVNVSRDNGRNFTRYDTGGTASVTNLAIAGAGSVTNPTLVKVYDDKFVDFIANINATSSGSWVQSGSLPNAKFLKSVIFDPTTNRYIVCGQANTGFDGYVAVSTDNTGTNYVQSTLPGSYSGVDLVDIVRSSSGVLVAVAEDAHTKVAFSTDGGVTWSDSTTTFASNAWRITYSPYFSEFFLIEATTASNLNREIYRSSDGDEWTLVADVDPGGSVAMGFNLTRAFIGSYGHALVTYGNNTDSNGGLGIALIAFSFDAGVTWDQVHIGEGLPFLIGGDLSANRMMVGFTQLGGAIIGRLA